MITAAKVLIIEGEGSAQVTVAITTAIIGAVRMIEWIVKLTGNECRLRFIKKFSLLI
jgi:hypothetical protein